MDTLSQVKNILSHYSGVDLPEIADDRPIGMDCDGAGLQLDSLDKLEVVVALEECFDIEIPDDDVDEPAMGTAAGIAAYIDRRIGVVRVEIEDDGDLTLHPMIAAARLQ